jgi:hypothetical protein
MIRTIVKYPIRPGELTVSFTTEGERRAETPNVAKAPTRIHFPLHRMLYPRAFLSASTLLVVLAQEQSNFVRR